MARRSEKIKVAAEKEIDIDRLATARRGQRTGFTEENPAEVLELLDWLRIGIRVNEQGRLAMSPAARVPPDLARRVKAVEASIRRLLEERVLVDKICITFDAKLVSVAGRDPGFEGAGTGPSVSPPFTCAFCGNDPARCHWCAAHAGDIGIHSCGDCTSGRTKPAPTGWQRGVVTDTSSSLIPDSIRAKIDEIEAEAVAAGWTRERLWNTGFWDQPRGLAAVLEPEDEIAEVTADYIAILKVEKNILRFQRRTS